MSAAQPIVCQPCSLRRAEYPLGALHARPLNPRVRTVGLLLGYLAGVVLGAALFAPWLYQAAQWAAGEFPALQGIASQPFHRYVNRCLLLGALAGLWPLLRSLRLGGWRALGFVNPLPAPRHLGLGLALGFGSLLVAGGMVVLTGGRSLAGGLSAPVLARLFLGAAASAIVVGLLEELLFRGVIFGALRRVWRLWPALLASAMFYSALHFLARVEHGGPVEWTSGLALLPRMARGIAAPHALIPAALSLALGGIALGLAYERTGNLWFSIGLHAGWVFWLKVFKAVTQPGAGGTNAFWGSEKLLDGWATFLVMAAVLAVVARLPETSQTPSNPDEPAGDKPRA